jgi:cytochrome P450
MLTTFLLPLLWTVVTYTLYVLLAVVLFLVSKALIYEMSYLYVMKKFTSENKDAVMGTYHPYKGLIGFMANPDVADIRIPIAKELADLSDKKLVIYHMPVLAPSTMAMVLNQPAVMKEYLAKEVEYTKKIIGPDFYPLMNIGFVQESGTQALMHKSVYSGFFNNERLSKLKFRMVPILEKKISSLIKQHKIDNSTFTEIDLREFLVVIQMAWITDIVFGCKQESELDIDLTAPECQGIKDHDFGHLNLQGLASVSLSQLLESFLKTSFGAGKDMPDQLCFGFLSRFGLTTKWAKHHLVKRILDKKIMGVYNKRYAEHVLDAGKQDDSGNLIDIMVQHNKKCLADGNSQELLTDDNIIGDVMVFIFAGIITTLQSSTSCLMHCTKSYPEWLDKIRADGVESLDAIMKNKSLDLVMKETLRVWNPMFSSFMRMTIKPMEICGMTIPKGTTIIPPIGWNRDKPYFVDGAKFRPERFEEEVPKLQKEQLASHTPYYEGKRKCLGYPLGEMAVKLLIGTMLKMFELENRQDGDIKMEIHVLYSTADPKIAIKLK